MTEVHKDLPMGKLYDVGSLAAYVASGYTLLTPNRRLALHVRKGLANHFAELGLAAWQAPKVMTADDWFAKRWHLLSSLDPRRTLGRRCLSSPQYNELWHQVVRESDTGQMLLRSEGAAQKAAEAYRSLLLWQVDINDKGIRAQFQYSDDSMVFLEWARDFERRCIERKVISAEQCSQLLLQHDICLPAEQLVLLEFDEIAPLHAAVLARVDDGLIRHSASRQMADCYQLACGSEDTEIYAAAHWAHRLLSSSDSKELSIGVLMPELGRQRGRVERIFNEVFDPDILRLADPDYHSPFNFSAGVTLAQTPVLSMALQLLRLLNGPVELTALNSVLFTRFCNHAERDYDRRVQILTRAHRQKQERLSSSTVRFLLLDQEDSEPPLKFGVALLQCWNDPRRKQRLSPQHWSSYFWDMLTKLGWPGAIDEHDIVPVEQLTRLLERFTAWESVRDTLTLDEAISLLGRELEQIQFQEKTEHVRVQILGRLEGAGLHFSHLWLTSMGASQWPTTATPNPFIPYQLQRALGLPHSTPDREFEYCRSLTERYRQSVGELVCSYVENLDDVVQGPSPLFPDSRVSSAQEFLQLEESSLYNRYWSKKAATLSTESILEPAAQGVKRPQVLPGGAGLLEAQANCGFRAFVRHGLGAKPLETVEISLSSLERGNIAHEALFRFWEGLDGSAVLIALDEVTLSARIDQCTRSALETLPAWRRASLGATTLKLEEERLHTLMARWLEVELHRPAFSVEDRELEREVSINGTRLRIRIDRVDRLLDERLLLIDYKTGRCAATDWLGEPPRRPQLPLYTVALPDTAGIAYGRLAMDKPELIVMQRELDDEESQAGDSWQDVLSKWQTSIAGLVDDYLDGKHNIDPLEGDRTCQYCDYATICRRHEWAARRD